MLCIQTFYCVSYTTTLLCLIYKHFIVSYIQTLHVCVSLFYFVRPCAPMAYPTGRINTLILKISSNNLLFGYAGDFHPASLDLQPSTLDSKLYAEIANNLMKQEGATSLIMVIPDECAVNFKNEIKNNLIGPDKSILFINRAVSEVFGNGKVSAVVLRCSKSGTSISLVIKGKLIETNKYGNGLGMIYEMIREIIKKRTNNKEKEQTIGNTEQIIVENAILGMNMDEYLNDDEIKQVNEKIEKLKEEIIGGVDEINRMLNTAQNMKGIGQIGIVLAGGICFYQGFTNKMIEKINLLMGDKNKEGMVYNSQLNAAFTGASVLGMNNQSKLLFEPIN